MRFDAVRERLHGIPYLTAEQGRALYDFVVEQKPAECLELGFAHGVSSCYIAAALDEVGGGHLTSVDLIDAAKWQQPSIEQLLAQLGLAQYVTVAREQNSYTWFLKKKIEERTSGNACTPIYDFCFVDGAKNWTIDGCAFFLVNKLLREGGWILFDDLNWSYRADVPPGQTRSDGVTIRTMGEDELATPHVDAIFRLLVMQHPEYGEFRIQNQWWGWARKVAAAQRVLRLEETRSTTFLALNVLRRLAGRKPHRGW